MRETIKKVPIPVCGVMLGTAALGNLLQSYSEGIRYACGIFAAFLLLLILLKLILFPNMIKEDMGNPIMASVAGTFSMALMILSTYVKPYIIFHDEIYCQDSNAESVCQLLYRVCGNCGGSDYSAGVRETGYWKRSVLVWSCDAGDPVDSCHLPVCEIIRGAQSGKTTDLYLCSACKSLSGGVCTVGSPEEL